jgi:serine/threonine protein kinase
VAQSGDKLGPYRLINLLMTGQTSQVWEAVDDETRKRVAVKMLLPEYRKDSMHVSFLKREFEVAGAVDHPRVIKIQGYATHMRIQYLTMELFPWPNMKFFVQRGVDRYAFLAEQLIRQAAEGLGALHSAGWVHRDIKPDNFLMSVEEGGEVKLIDFALAQKPAGFMQRLFGGRGKVQGTRSYMAPEQIRGKAADLRSDIYSFGCTVHELLYGKPPFAGFTANELLQKHLRSAPPPLTALNRNVTEEFAALILTTLAKKPDDRPQSMDKFLESYRRVRVFKTTPKPLADEAKGKGEERLV